MPIVHLPDDNRAEPAYQTSITRDSTQRGPEVTQVGDHSGRNDSKSNSSITLWLEPKTAAFCAKTISSYICNVSVVCDHREQLPVATTGTHPITQDACPRGLRGGTQVAIASAARVRTPPRLNQAHFCAPSRIHSLSL